MPIFWNPDGTVNTPKSSNKVLAELSLLLFLLMVLGGLLTRVQGTCSLGTQFCFASQAQPQ